MNDSLPGLLNYWVVICLMMTGFYIVIGQRNLIKSILGLNIFQTSVFLLYITMGKISGGTAPIVPPSLVEAGADHSGSVEQPGHADGPHEFHEGSSDRDLESHHGADASHGESHAFSQAAESPATIGDGNRFAPDHHFTANELTGAGHDDVSFHDSDKTHLATTGGPPLVYSNPLPSVLMLTAIVVGIATTALALALVVRVKEDYGTIEEDEILAIERAAIADATIGPGNVDGQTELPTE